MNINYTSKIFGILIIYVSMIKIIESTLQANLDDGKENCFIEELYTSSVASIKWKIELGSMLLAQKQNKTKEEISKMVPEEILKNIYIIVKDEENDEILKVFQANNSKDKNSFQSEKNGSYKICAQYRGKRLLHENIFYSVKIHSNNMDEPNLNKVIKKQDIDPLLKQINSIVEKGREIFTKQNTELEDEDHYAKLQMNITSNYNIMNLIQVLVILALGIYQVFSFRKFLIANNLL